MRPSFVRTWRPLLITLLVVSSGGGARGSEPQTDGSSERRRPGEPPPPNTPPAESPPEDAPPGTVADRRRLVHQIGVRDAWWNPYRASTAKGDFPIGGEWRLRVDLANLTWVGMFTGPGPDGAPEDLRARSTTRAGLAISHGGTTFRPPDVALDAAAELLVQATGEGAEVRPDMRSAHVELFLGTRSRAFDLDVLRVGLQAARADRTGWVLRGDQPGVRVAGTRFAQRLHFQLAWFRHVPAEALSGRLLWGEALVSREIAVGTATLQDVGVRGHDLQAGALGMWARDGDRREDLATAWVGAFGRLGRLGVAWTALGTIGSTGTVGERHAVRAGLVHAELHYSVDAWSGRFVAVVASGEGPGAGRTGFDPPGSAPLVPGARFSVWANHPLRRTDGGALTTLVGFLPRAAESHGGPGLYWAGLGVTGALHRTLEWSADVAILDTVTGPVGVGVDVSTGLEWRPTWTPHVVLLLGGGVLVPGSGVRSWAEVPGTVAAVNGGVRLVY
jgi:hypothetical protein